MRIEVDGEIELPAGVVLGPRTVAYVRLLDTSLADAASRTLAEQVIDDVRGRTATGGPLSFKLRADAAGPGGSYTLAAHVSIEGGREIAARRPGDRAELSGDSARPAAPNGDRRGTGDLTSRTGTPAGPVPTSSVIAASSCSGT